MKIKPEVTVLSRFSFENGDSFEVWERDGKGNARLVSSWKTRREADNEASSLRKKFS